MSRGACAKGWFNNEHVGKMAVGCEPDHVEDRLDYPTPREHLTMVDCLLYGL